jgi:tetratricopeptide (TPR) repeat protein
MLIYDSDQTVRMRARGLLARMLRPIIDRDNAAAAKTPKPSSGVTTPNFAGPSALRSPPTPVVAGGTLPDGGVPSDAGVPCVDGGPCDGGLVSDAGVPSDGGAPSDGGTRPPDLGDATALQDPARLPEVIIAQYLDTSIGALKDKDYKKAQKLLERASSLCAKKGKRWKQCEKLAPEIAYQLASDYEAQGQWADAAAEYQKVKSKHPRQREAQTAIERLALRLGRIEIYKLVGSRCVHATLYMEPGIHRVSLGNGQSPMVQVKAGQTAEVKLCSPR